MRLYLNRRSRSAALIILVGLSSSLVPVAAQQTGEIVVRVVGLGSNKGEVRFGLYDNSKAFKKGADYSIRRGTCYPITECQCEFTIAEVPYGHYAVMVGHDENQNGKIDWISGERAGASNYKHKLRWYPDFDKAQFDHSKQKTILEIPVF
jgi:uncharacterized protein (DUF2141 family)